MSPVALALVLTAALCHALWNAAARGARGDGGLFVFLYSAAACLVWLPVTAVWLVAARHDPPSWTWVGAGAVSGVLHAAYGVVLQRGYRRGDLSLVYPVARGVGPLVTLVVSVVVLGQRPSVPATLGAALVVGGIAVISAPDRLAERSAVVAGLTWGGATGLTIATYTLFDAVSITRLEVPPLPYYAASLVITTLTLAPRSLRRRDDLRASRRANWRPALVVGVLSPLAYVLVLEAVRTTPVALVAATRESSIVLGTALGVVVFHEAGGWRRALGAVVVLIGLAFVALG